MAAASAGFISATPLDFSTSSAAIAENGKLNETANVKANAADKTELVFMKIPLLCVLWKNII
jgi:hypothetical protein